MPLQELLEKLRYLDDKMVTLEVQLCVRDVGSEKGNGNNLESFNLIMTCGSCSS